MNKIIQLVNDKQWPNVYSCRFLEAGIVSYKDSKDGILRLTKETIDKMAPTFIGKPVLINHKKVGPENFKNEAVGYVINVKFNPNDAWFHCDFLITDEKARELIEKQNYSVSCAYNVISGKEGGSYHDIPYDGEITDGQFTHLALVENPRYEDSRISKQIPEMLVNDKSAHFITNKEESDMNIKELVNSIFNKKADGTKENVNPIVMLNGKEYPLATVLEAIQEKFNAEGEMKGVMADDSQIVDINGHQYSIGEAKNALKEKLENERKNCTCGMKDGEHKEDCKMNKKNMKNGEEDLAKKEEEKGEDKKKEEEKENSKESEEMKALRLENETLKKKKNADELFNSLNDLSNYNGEDKGDSTSKAPLSRTERANKKKEQIAKQPQFAGASK